MTGCCVHSKLIPPLKTHNESTLTAAQGTTSAEVQALQAVRGAASGATAYLNLEPGDCHGDDAAIRSMLSAGVARVVVALKHPLPHMRGAAIQALRSAGVAVGTCTCFVGSCSCKQCFAISKPALVSQIGRHAGTNPSPIMYVV